MTEATGRELAGDGTAGPAGDDFAATTAITPLGGGRYRCVLDPRWSALAGINGGILLAVITRAVAAEVGRDRGLRTVQCQFMRPPAPGDAELEVVTLRTGKRATNLRVQLTQQGRLILEALVVCFAGGLREVASWAPAMPDVEPPGAEPSSIADPRMPAIAERLTYTPRLGPPPLSGTPVPPGKPARTGGWLQLKGDQPIDAAVLAFFADAWWPASLGPLNQLAFNPTIDLTFHLRAQLPPEGLPAQPLLLDVTTIAMQEGLVDEDARLYSADGTLLAQSRQLAITMTPDDRPPVTKADVPS